jgi:hypothetical protein
MKIKVEYLLWLSLVLALAGSLKHLAGIFASIDGNVILGWLQAVAIDAGLFALAYSIRVRKVAKRSTKPLWIGVTVFTGISVYGNLSYGLLAIDGNLPVWIVASKPYVLAASLPVLVLFLSELLSDDRQHATEMAEREARKVARQGTVATGKTEIATENTEDLPEESDSLASINTDRKAAKAEKLQEFATVYQEKPHASVTEFASVLNVSRATVRNYASELGLELATNGNGKVAI